VRRDLIAPTSRYARTATRTLVLADGREIVYLERRFIPGEERFETIREHLVEDGDRLDNLAAAYLGDPEQFWRLADANGAMNPRELLVPGSRLRITLPEGMAGPPRE
jgi:hypothetical protein